MKQIISFLIALLCAGAASACEVCGCSATSPYMGILPQNNRHFAGLRYSFRAFNTQHPPSIIPAYNGTTSDEYYHTLEAWGRFYPVKRLQLMLVIPFNFYRQVSQAEDFSVNTIGDISLMAGYEVVSTADTVRKLRHTLLLGAGLKAPTGPYDLRTAAGETLNPNLQPGSGSWDILFTAAYTLRWKSGWGANAEGSFRLSTVNPVLYRFGQRFGFAAKAFYLLKWKKLSLMPSAGITYEHAWSDELNRSAVDYTGGSMAGAFFGADLYYGRFSIGAGTQVPAWNNLSKGHVTAYPRISAQFIVFI